MECLLATYLSMLGDYATSLQNDGTSLEAFFKERSTWTHLWKESISSFDGNGASGSKRTRALSPVPPALPTDLSETRDMNTKFLSSMQSSIDKRFKGLDSSGSSASPAVPTADGDNAPLRKVYKGKKAAHHRGASRRGGGKGGKGK